MSENWTDSGSSHDSPVDVERDRPAALNSIPGVIEREGLPAAYRMRADSHYVEQLFAPSETPVVRQIPIAQIDCDASPAQRTLRSLIESIRRVGIVHPLLVARQHGRFSVIAGRGRLAAAKTLRLLSVPCLVHDVSDAEAEALHAADNMTVSTAEASRPAADVGPVIAALSGEAGAVRQCAAMVLDGDAALTRVSLTLVAAHAWRADRLARAAALLTRRPEPRERGRERSLAGVIDEVIAGFASEAQLSGVIIRAEVGEGSLLDLNAEEFGWALSAALLATLHIVERAPQAAIVVKAGGTSERLAVHILQSEVAVSPASVASLFDASPGCSTQSAAAAFAAMAARTFVERHGGTVTFEAVEHGSRLTMLWDRS